MAPPERMRDDDAHAAVQEEAPSNLKEQPPNIRMRLYIARIEDPFLQCELAEADGIYGADDGAEPLSSHRLTTYVQHESMQPHARLPALPEPPERTRDEIVCAALQDKRQVRRLAAV